MTKSNTGCDCDSIEVLHMFIVEGTVILIRGGNIHDRKFSQTLEAGLLVSPFKPKVMRAMVALHTTVVTRRD